VGSRIAKNSIFNLVRTLITIPLTIFITPFIIKHVGREGFGIWALVGVISSYAQLSDFGITDSLIKFMAEYKAKNDTLQLNKLINTAFTVYIAISAVFGFLLLSILPFLIKTILSIPPEFSAKANYIFTIAIALFFVNMTMGVFGSLIIGFQRMGYSNLISLISTIIMACGTVLILGNGYGLEGLIHNNILITLFVMISNFFVAWRLFPQMRLNPFKYFSKDTLRLIFGFSWKVQLSSISNLLVYQVDRVLLSHFLGLSAVSNYEIANRIASQAKGFIGSVFTPMTPAASSLQATDGIDKLRGLYNRSMKYMAIAAIPFSLLIVALAHPFVRTWMGEGYATSAYTLQFLMLSYMLNLLPGPGNFILSGMNKPEIPMRTSIFAGVVNLTLCYVLVQTLGYYGIIVGIFSSIVMSGLLFTILVHQNIQGLSWGLYPAIFARPALVSAILSLALLMLNNFYDLKGYAQLCFVSVIYFCIVSFVLSKGKYLDAFDRSTIARLNPLAKFM
jgi:O-antigen/teichoic acid export membrane protein